MGALTKGGHKGRPYYYMRGFEILIGLLLIPIALFFYLWSFYEHMEERKDAAWRRAARNWLAARAAMDAAKDKILALAKEESCYGAGVKHLRNLKAGAVAYKEIPELKSVDLDQYRRPGRFESRISAI